MLAANGMHKRLPPVRYSTHVDHGMSRDAQSDKCAPTTYPMLLIATAANKANTGLRTAT